VATHFALVGKDMRGRYLEDRPRIEKNQVKERKKPGRKGFVRFFDL